MNRTPAPTRKSRSAPKGAGRRLAGYLFVFALRDVFPVSFYGRDLREKAKTLVSSLRSCVSTVLNLTTLSILVVTTLLVAALYLGTVGWLRDYVESNPLARTVEVSSIFGMRTAAFEKADLDELRSLRIYGKSESPVEAVHGWNDVTFWFFDAAQSQDDELTHGRTVSPDDPLLERLDFLRGGGGFEGDGTGQIVVSASLLSALGYDSQAPYPETIRLDYFDLEAPLEVIGIAARTPAGDFLVTEAFHRQIQDRRWDPLPRIPGFYWGPAPPETLETTLSELAGFLGNRRVTGEIQRRAGTEQWILISRSEAWTEEQWAQLFLPVFERRVDDAAPRARIEWREPLAPQLEPRPRLQSSFTRASIYVRELSQVPPVAEDVTARGYQVTSNSRELALLFLQISSLGRGILLAVILVVGGLAAVSLVLSFSQNIQRKTPEIAILKAYGASNGLVLAAYVAEALILWALSASAGLFVAERIAGGVERRLVSLLQLQGSLPGVGETSLVFMPWQLQGAVAAGALVLCVAATLLAGSLAVRLQPAQALSLHR